MCSIKGEYIMNETQENYNETVLIPILQKRVNNLTTDTLLLEAKLEIANKEKTKLEEQINNLTNQLNSKTDSSNTEN
jgi:uncharacterized protein YlxW (UPF0749 family)